jgi:anti-anti-sigma regulatory factor
MVPVEQRPDADQPEPQAAHAIPLPGAAAGAEVFAPAKGFALPFAVENMPGAVIITLSARAMTDANLLDPRAFQWIHGARGRVLVDLTCVHAINSLGCNWLVHLMQAARPATLAITGANWRVAETLRILRLDALMEIELPARPPGQHQRPRPPSGTGEHHGLE